MKLNKMSIKYKLFFYFAIFAAVVLVMLWLFQIVFLDDFYKQIKMNNIKSSAASIEKNIDSEELDTLLKTIETRNETNIKIFDTDGNVIYSTEVIRENILDRMQSGEFKQLYQKALQNEGTFFEVFSKDDFMNKPEIDQPFDGNDFKKPKKDISQSMVYATIVDKADGSQAFIVLNSAITPVTATVNTLRVQLVYVTVITLLLAISMALFISRRISKPIIKINASAKELAKGKYDTAFLGKGYLEIEELNDTLNYAANELSKVEGLRRELIANISHDLRTPLTMITGYGEVMRDLPGENTPENVQIIIDEAKRLTTLVNDILDISQFQSGTQKITLQKFNLTQSIRDILKRYTKLTEQDGYKLKFISGEDIWINADPIKISQVIYNLINNAITYTGEDKTVTIIQSSTNDAVKLEIVDSGEGIPEDKLPLIWDRYYKVDKAHKRAAIGTGLGLSIVKTVLEMHSAKYGVFSTQGQGSIFWFELQRE